MPQVPDSSKPDSGDFRAQQKRGNAGRVLIVAALAAVAAVFLWQFRKIADLKAVAADLELKHRPGATVVTLLPPATPALAIPAVPSRIPAPLEPWAVTTPVKGLPLKMGPTTWRDAGQSNPESTFKTALWAASNGNLERLSELIALDEAAGKKAQALFDSLPADSRAHFGTVEVLLAALAASHLPNGAVSVMHRASAYQKLELWIQYNAFGPENDAVKQGPLFTTVSFVPTDAGWKMEMPEKAVDQYAADLRGQYKP